MADYYAYFRSGPYRALIHFPTAEEIQNGAKGIMVIRIEKIGPAEGSRSRAKSPKKRKTN